MKRFLILYLFVISLTTATYASTVPEVRTEKAYDINSNSASLGFNVLSIGSSPITEFGIEIGTTSQYGFQVKQKSYISDTGPYPIHISNPGSALTLNSDINCSTLYHFRGYATNDSGTGYGEDMTFKTADCDAPTYQPVIPLGPENTPGVETFKPTRITHDSALFNGKLTRMGGADTILVNFSFYKDTPEHEFGVGETSFGSISMTKIGKFSINTEEILQCNTVYNVYAKATKVINLKEGKSVFTNGKVLKLKTLPCDKEALKETDVDAKEVMLENKQNISQSKKRRGFKKTMLYFLKLGFIR